MGQSYRAIITIMEPMGGGGHPDQGLPGGGWGGGHPDHGLPGGHPGHPDQGLPGGGGSAGQLPVWPDDAPPGTVWPPLPPGHGGGEGTKAIVLAAIEGVGYRYVVVSIGDQPDQGLPGEGEEGPDEPDQELPGGQPHPGNRPPGSTGPRPDQGLPGGQPHPGNRPPGSIGGQPRPGQGLPPAPQPKPVGRR